MKKFLSVILPIVIIFSLAGCLTDEDVTYLKPDLRYIERYTDDGAKWSTRYETRVGGRWYDSDADGNLTDKGKLQKQQAEMQASGDDGGGGGGGGC